MEAPGHLEFGNALLQKFAKAALIERAAGLYYDKGGRHFTPLRVGRGDNGALEHRIVRGDGALDFDGRNVLAAGDDDVLLAVDDVYARLLVPYGHVAAVQPAVGHHVGRGLRFLVVAVHDVV